MSHRTTGCLKWEGTIGIALRRVTSRRVWNTSVEGEPPAPSGQLLSVVPLPELRRSPLPEAVPWQRGSPSAPTWGRPPTRVSGKGNPLEKTLFPPSRRQEGAVPGQSSGIQRSRHCSRKDASALWDRLTFFSLSFSECVPPPHCGQTPPPTPSTPRRARHRSSPRRALTPRAM